MILSLRLATAGVLALGLCASPGAEAQTPAQGARPAAAAAKPEPKAEPRDRSSAFGTLGSNKEPIKIDADRLDVFDREGRAVFAGNVVAVQGEATMRCASLTVLYEQNRAAGGQAGAAPRAAGPGGGDSQIKKIDCTGPVTVVSRTQTATSDNATFDRQANRVYLIGNATLADGPNVTQGDRVVYDLNTGVANVENAKTGRVRALFVPGSNPEAGKAAPAAAAPAAPAPAAAAPAAPKPAPTARAQRPAPATN